MKKYLKTSIICMDYEDMMATFEMVYADKYDLIGYQLTKQTDISYRAILTLSSKKGVENE